MDTIISGYRYLKNMPTPRSGSTGRPFKDDEYIAKIFIVYGILPTIALILIVVAVIHYETIFRSIKDVKTYKEQSEDKDDSYEQYYSIPENEMARNVYGPFVGVSVFILFCGFLKYLAQ